MAPVVFGLDFKELKWGKFKSSYMFGNKEFHLRRTKFVVYQAAMIFCVISESLGTAVLSDFVDSQKYLSNHSGGRAVLHNDDYVGMASYNIFAGVFVAFIFGAAFFFDLFWPTRHEDRGIRIAWKACSVASCVFMLASIILEVVIVTTRSAYVTGVSTEEANALLAAAGKGNVLDYKKNGRAVASVVFAWLGFPFVVISTIIMWMSINHIEREGPFARHAQEASEAGPTEAFHQDAAEMKNMSQSSDRTPAGKSFDTRRPSRDEVYEGT